MTELTHQSRDSRAFGWWDVVAICSLWALVVFFFWGITGAGRVLAGGDVFTYFYPYWAEATRAFQSGRIPLWNKYIFMGAPFLANSQSGTLYPLNWLVWRVLPAHTSIHVSIGAHLCLAALNAYLWGRRGLRLSPIGAWIVGALFALGGYLGAQVEHVNQLQGLAWLPLAILLVDLTTYAALAGARRRYVLSFAGLAGVIGLILLAGHAQTAFISLVGLAAYAVMPAVWRAFNQRLQGKAHLCDLMMRLGLVAGTAVAGAALAAAQLLPTVELSGLSIRAGGLPFNERLSFSLSPVYLGRALMPGYGTAVSPEHLEYVAYVGVVGISLIAITIRRIRFASLPIWSATGFLVLGLFFSLGLFNPLYVLFARFLPGFAHFRVPARWLALYALGGAGLAGWGAEQYWKGGRQVSLRDLLWLASILVIAAGWAGLGMRLVEGVAVAWLTVLAWIISIGAVLAMIIVSNWAPKAATFGLIALIVIELFIARTGLPYARATAPQAFTSMRPAIAQLVVGSPGRYLSMSDITFDPGDLGEISVIYRDQLAADELYDYIIATKQKEVLSPNLSMVFGVTALDGYDGGLLPLSRYVTLQRLFLSDEQVSMDGRLREKLSAIPPGRWLDLFNVRYIVTDKLHDAWLDDVFYDLQMGARLSEGETAEVADIPEFQFLALGVVSYLQGAADLADGAQAGVVEVSFADGSTQTFELLAGRHTAEGLYTADVAHSQAIIGGHYWPGQPDGCDYVARLRWDEPAVPVSIRVQATLPDGELVIRGVSLIDERTGGFQSLVISDQGPYQLAHSGDVKIYENMDVLLRAFVVHSTVVADDEAALARMRASDFDPAVEAVLADDGPPVSGTSILASRPDTVRIVRDEPELIEISVDASSPGYLILTDAWYPGWRATVDGQTVAVARANILFRAVPVDAGAHHVVFSYQPVSLRFGVAISAAALVMLLLVIAVGWLEIGRGRNPTRGAVMR